MLETTQQQGDRVARAKVLSEELRHRDAEFNPDVRQLRDTQQRIEGFLNACRETRAQQSLRARWSVFWLRWSWRSHAPDVAWRIKEAEELGQKSQLFRLLRLIRVEIVELRETSQRVRDGRASISELHAFVPPGTGPRDADPSSAEAVEVRSTSTRVWFDEASVVETTSTHELALHPARGGQSVETALSKAEELVDRDPDLQRYSDELLHLRHHWRQIETAIGGLLPSNDGPPKDGANGHERVVAALDEIDALCSETIFFIGWRTIPARLRRWLNQTWTGSSVSFHRAFEDEVPDEKVRKRIVALLASQPGRLPGGLADPEAGMIYKYSMTRWRGLVSAAPILVLIALTVLAILGGKILDFLPSKSSDAFLYWGALLTGVVFHVAVDALKRETTVGRTVMFAHPLRWMSARVWHLSLRLLMIFVGFVGGLALFGHESRNTLIVSMFLVGYGLDSFVGIFTESVAQRASKQAAAARKTLGLEPGA